MKDMGSGNALKVQGHFILTEQLYKKFNPGATAFAHQFFPLMNAIMKSPALWRPWRFIARLN
jgi:hypothetical protein